MLMRLNSSKQHHAPDWASPEKNRPIICVCVCVCVCAGGHVGQVHAEIESIMFGLCHAHIIKLGGNPTNSAAYVVAH